VLRIMAGLDKEFTGEAWLAEGATCGYLPQEPQLDESLNVLGKRHGRAWPTRRRSSTATTS
jgi:ATPase subunit of ABC transporter with duplicated ATPase domains